MYMYFAYGEWKLERGAKKCLHKALVKLSRDLETPSMFQARKSFAEDISAFKFAILDGFKPKTLKYKTRHNLC